MSLATVNFSNIFWYLSDIAFSFLWKYNFWQLIQKLPLHLQTIKYHQISIIFSREVVHFLKRLPDFQFYDQIRRKSHFSNDLHSWLTDIFTRLQFNFLKPGLIAWRLRYRKTSYLSQWFYMRQLVAQKYSRGILQKAKFAFLSALGWIFPFFGGKNSALKRTHSQLINDHALGVFGDRKLKLQFL